MRVARHVLDQLTLEREPDPQRRRRCRRKRRVVVTAAPADPAARAIEREARAPRTRRSRRSRPPPRRRSARAARTATATSSSAVTAWNASKRAPVDDPRIRDRSSPAPRASPSMPRRLDLAALRRVHRDHRAGRQPRSQHALLAAPDRDARRQRARRPSSRRESRATCAGWLACHAGLGHRGGGTGGSKVTWRAS